jgi:hypothetical protein
VPFTCGRHRAFVYERGGTTPVGELTPATSVRWNRIRDNISEAYAQIGTTNCCDLLGDLRTVLHELHIERDGVEVWQGPITRIEYEWDNVKIYAEDMLWVAKRTVLRTGYDQSYPNIGNVVDRMDWLLRSQTFARNNDPWKMVPHLHPVRTTDEPSTTRKVGAFQYYTWEDFDKYAEDNGTDYTVVGRDIYYWDVHLRWKIIASLSDDHLSQFPRIVEYGNQAATQGFVSNTEGYAGTASAPQTMLDLYGDIDWLITNLDDSDLSAPNAAEIESWSKTAARNIADRAPAPVAIVIPANTTLLPGAPWAVEDLVPGAWFIATATRMCRKISEWQRLHEVRVEESAPKGETVSFTAVAAPGSVSDLPPGTLP